MHFVIRFPLFLPIYSVQQGTQGSEVHCCLVREGVKLYWLSHRFWCMSLGVLALCLSISLNWLNFENFFNRWNFEWDLIIVDYLSLWSLLWPSQKTTVQILVFLLIFRLFFEWTEYVRFVGLWNLSRVLTTWLYSRGDPRLLLSVVRFCPDVFMGWTK